MFRKGILAAMSVCALAAFTPSIASADIMSEIKAGNRAEQKMSRVYPGYTVYAFCDQQGRRYWCTVGGSRGDCFVSGHAWVKRYPWRVRFSGVTKDCF